jgi:tetratricopeptide (TPR) repeat protein
MSAILPVSAPSPVKIIITIQQICSSHHFIWWVSSLSLSTIGTNIAICTAQLSLIASSKSLLIWGIMLQSHICNLAAHALSAFWPTGTVVAAGITGPLIDFPLTDIDFGMKAYLSERKLMRVREMAVTEGEQPTQQYFEQSRFSDVQATLRTAISQKNGGLILTGLPLVGKTRMVTEALRRVAPDFTLLTWDLLSSFKGKSITRIISRLNGREIVLLIDNLHEKIHQESEIDKIIDCVQRLREAASCVIVVGTVRPIHSPTAELFQIVYDTLNLTILSLEPLTDVAERNEFLDFVHEQKIGIPAQDEVTFDGIIGKILLDINQRTGQLGDESFPADARTILKTLALLRNAGIFTFPQKRVLRVAAGIFHLLPANEREALIFLVKNKWIKIEQATGEIFPLADAYIDICLPAANQLDDHSFPELINILAATPTDREALFQMSRALRVTPPIGRSKRDELVLRCTELAMRGLKRSFSPERWANGKYLLGNAYMESIVGDRADNLERAIDAYQTALTIYTCDAFPTEWARAQHSLGIAYQERIKGDRIDNIERAIAAYQAALIIYMRDKFPFQCATTQNNLGRSYQARISGNRSDNLEHAIAAYQIALTVYTRDAYPVDWARVQNNLGNGYLYRIVGNRSDNLERAIEAYQNALLVRVYEQFPSQWARTRNNLGIAYLHRVKGDREENLKQSIDIFEKTLAFCAPNAQPEDWARAQSNLGNVYLYCIEGDRAYNIERAIAAYQATLAIYTRATHPEDWARTQSSLGNAYLHRIGGERVENLERAIIFYKAALTVYTQNTHPNYWATAQSGLGNAYQARIDGIRAENLERARIAYQAALTVHSRHAYPIDWARTQQNLALLHGTLAAEARERGDMAACHRYCDQAIAEEGEIRDYFMSIGNEAQVQKAEEISLWMEEIAR